MISGDIPSWGEFFIRSAEMIGTAIFTAGSTVYFIARKTFASKDEMAKRFEEHDAEHDVLMRRLADGEREFAAIKGTLDHLPDQDDFRALADRISAVEGSVQGLTATIDGLKELLERVERPLNLLVDHHMKGGWS